MRGCAGRAVTGRYGRPSAGPIARIAPDGARHGAVPPRGRPARQRRPEFAGHRSERSTPRDGHGGASGARCDVATETGRGGSRTAVDDDVSGAGLRRARSPGAWRRTRPGDGFRADPPPSPGTVPVRRVPTTRPRTSACAPVRRSAHPPRAPPRGAAAPPATGRVARATPIRCRHHRRIPGDGHGGHINATFHHAIPLDSPGGMPVRRPGKATRVAHGAKLRPELIGASASRAGT